MGGCCGPTGYEIFGLRTARRDARRYRRRGLDRTARLIVEQMREGGVLGASVLEVGGGVGALELELLRAGAERATCVEVSPAYDEPARELAREAGLAEKVERRRADFVEEADSVEPADLVVMHRVVCCYPDAAALVGVAARHARRQLVLSFPRDVWWTRLGARAANAWLSLVRRRFRVFVHETATVVGSAEAEGLHVVRRQRGRLWQMVAFAR